MTPRACPSSDAGFTLVEALVSLFVFSIVAGGAALLLTQTVSAQKQVAAAHESLRGLQITRALLAADLAQIAVRSVRADTGGHAPLFVGGDAEAAMAFVRAAGARDASFGATNRLAYVRYVIEGDRLVRYSRAELDTGPTELGERRVLLEGASALKLQFFDGGRWVDAWAGASAPKAVALEASVERYGEVRIEALVGLGP